MLTNLLTLILSQKKYERSNTKILKVFEQYILYKYWAPGLSPRDASAPRRASSALASLPESAVGASGTAAAQHPAVQQRKPTDVPKDKTQRRKPIKQNSPQAQKRKVNKKDYINNFIL